MGALQSALAEEDPVVGDDSDRVALDVTESADQRLAVERLELVEVAPVEDSRQQLIDRQPPPRLGRQRAILRRARAAQNCSQLPIHRREKSRR